ncbi:hypothetical protein F4780DRAFT_378765 [Xylariomycetidae sp. FL0641]|nr:hypothetical protein F4780DRAFT_378765 [Xylariomycetidae sp. FL0641]
MGKPSDDLPADAVSLHTNPGETSTAAFTDDDAPDISIADDLPPTYGDALEFEGAPMLPPSNDGAIQPLDSDAIVRVDLNNGTRWWLAKSLENPSTLESYMKRLATVPPRPYIKLVGTHTETSKDGKGKSSKSTVTDFDVSVDMTPYLFSNVQYRKSWNHLRTVENYEETYRGTILRKRAPGAQQSIELGAAPTPTLQEWCHRYAASHAGLKVFTLRREVVGFDEEYIKRRLTSMVRDTNYRGYLKVEFVTNDARIECFNDTKINRWRFNSWIQWFFTLTLLFILSWPCLWLSTKKWEVAIAEWPFSRPNAAGEKEYVSITEEQWYNMWGRAICRAVLEKRQKTLDQNDLRQAEEAGQPFDSGNAQVNGAVGLFRAGIHAMNEVNRQLGWGGDC